jgi:hypothetical protein
VKKPPSSGVAIAAAVASMLAAGFAGGHNHHKEKSRGVRCAGVNACQGKGECGGVGSACRGMNDCKGQAWVTVASKQECVARGGRVVAGPQHNK